MSKRKTGALRAQSQDTRFAVSKKSNQTFYMNESKTINFDQARGKAKKAVNLVPKTLNQERFIVALLDEETDVVITGGPAGTGKTYLSTVAAIQALRERKVQRIVLCRPSVSIEGESHGFLPGDLTSKLAPWVRPITDILREFYSVQEIEGMIADETIEFASLGLMRGRTLKNTFMILDEAQNSSPLQLKSLLTRIGEGSKIVINGDINQSDRKTPDNGLHDLICRLKNRPINGVQVCEFNLSDVQRHRLIGEFIELYK